jgi:tetratricopeptide (TPR) repeat protein
MNSSDVKQRVLSALPLLREGRRDEAADMLAKAIAAGPPTGELWKSVAKLAAQIGEIELALEASRRFAATPPVKMSRVLEFWKDLTSFGRSDIVEQEVSRFQDQVGGHPAVLHVLGQMAAQSGKFEEATNLYLRVVEDPEFAAQGYFSLAMISDMNEHPAWIDRMLALEGADLSADPSGRSRLLYGLGKAFHDCGDYARAMDCFSRGAAARRSEAQYNPEQLESFALATTRDFTPEAMDALKAPGETPRASIFVNGLPRSGTTLVEQILVANSRVHDGAEVNLARAALLTTVDYSYAGTVAYDRTMTDPWGTVAKNYERMLNMRFRTNSLCVDKSLTQSHIMGLIVHAMPACPVIWMRRNIADIAISCYRTLFTSPLPWCWEFEDMGHFFAVEDALFAHWTKVLGDRILAVDYQQLVHEPGAHIAQITSHAGLDWEEGQDRFHENKTSVRTASLQQVRQPISTARIGQSEPYSKWMDGFWRSYETASKRIAARS